VRDFRLTLTACSYIVLHCEGSVDFQFLCGRLGWLELVAKPSSLDSKSNWEPTSEEWESMSCLRFQYETASLEALLAVHSRGSQVVVSDAPTDRSDLCRLNRLNELSPAMTLSGMRRLIDSDKSPAFSLLVPHPCSCTRGRSVGRGLFLCSPSGPPAHSQWAREAPDERIHQGTLGFRGTNLSTFSTREQCRGV
jgi:hypothetical protein